MSVTYEGMRFRNPEEAGIRAQKLNLLLEHMIAAELVTLDDVIAAIVALAAPAADQIFYFTSATAAAYTGLTAFARTFLDDVDAGTVRGTIGAEPTIAAGTAAQYWRGDKSWQTLNGAAVAFTPAGSLSSVTIQLALEELDTEKQPKEATLTALAAMPATLGLLEQTSADVFGIRLIGVANATDILTRADGDGRYQLQSTFAETVDDRVATLLGAGGTNISITYDDGANTATVAISDAQLNAMAALTPAANQIMYWSGATTAVMTGFTSQARDLCDDTSFSAMRTTLGLAIGTDVQALHANLTAFAGLSLVADRLPYANGTGALALATFTAAGRALIDDADAAAQRTTLGLGTAAVKNTGASGDAVPLLNVANTWSATQNVYGATGVAVNVGVSTDSNRGGQIKATGAGGAGVFYIGSTSGGYPVELGVDGATILSLSTTGIDVAGEARCNTLRIDATATAATPTPTHTVPININGTVYRFPCVI